MSYKNQNYKINYKIQEEVNKLQKDYVDPDENIEETVTKELSLVSNKNTISYDDNDSATLTATYSENSEPVAGKTIIIEVYNSEETTLLDTLTVTDNNNGTYTTTYDGSAANNVVIIAKCGNVTSETITIQKQSAPVPVRLTHYVSENNAGEYTYIDWTQANVSTITIDWGDDSSVETVSSRTFHEYTTGEYTITITGENITEIPTNAFTYAIMYAKSLFVPSSITRLGACINNHSTFESIYFEPTTPPVLYDDPFSIIPKNITIYVPAGSLNAYTSAEGYPDPSEYTYVEY